MMKVYVFKALDHLHMIPQEMEMLKHMQGLKDGSIQDQPSAAPRRPMKPMVLTKEMVMMTFWFAILLSWSDCPV